MYLTKTDYIDIEVTENEVPRKKANMTTKYVFHGIQ